MSYPPQIKPIGRPKGIPRSKESIAKQKDTLQKSKDQGKYLPWGFKPKEKL